MEFVVSLLERLGQAAVSLLLNPFYYISILIVVLQMRRQIFFERKLYHSRIHTLVGQSVSIVLWGLLAGLIGSLIMGFVGASLQPEAVIYLWIGALLLSLIRIRFICFAYVIGLMGAVHAVMGWIPGLNRPNESWYAWIQPFVDVHMPSLLALVGVVHIIEALLVRIQGERLATPVFIEGKRGKLVGAYQFQGLWPVPLLLVVPASSGGQALPLMPLFGGGAMWADGWIFLALPIMIGFTDMTVSMLPRQKTARTSGHLLLYGVIITALAAATEWLPVLIVPASLLTIALHELIIWYAERGEKDRSPIFVHSDRGLTVLATLPKSAARTLGIKAGEIIHKVNGQAVRTKEELHQALRLNAAFSRLEIIDHNGEHRFVQRPLFEGEHHQLGIVLSPDDQAEFYVKAKRFNMFREFRSTLGKHRSDRGISG